MTLPPSTSIAAPGTTETTGGDTVKDSHERGRSVPVSMQWYLFVVLAADQPLSGGARYALAGIDEVMIGRGAERSAVRSVDDGARRLTLRLPGRSVSGTHARIVQGISGWTLQDAGSTNGCFVNGKRVERALLAPGDVIEVGHTFLLIGGFPLPLDQAPEDLDGQHPDQAPLGFTTLVPPLAAHMRELARIATSNVTVLLCGESGTGKELLARGVHTLSKRSGPFVAVNCGALTDTLAESQMFGHLRGAFTGAVADAVGFVRAADGGTLLLDEVGDLSRPAQVALLRVLQEREVVPVGGARAYKVDVRFVASSPRPLDRPELGGPFRSDLLARISGYTYPTTPLRNRREDVGLLVASILDRSGVTAADGPSLTPDAALRLLQHPWPLNVRELEHALVRAWALSAGGVIDLAHLALDGGCSQEKSSSAGAPILSPKEEQLRREIIAALIASDGNVAQVARNLGKARMQLHRWMKRLAIDPSSYRR